MRKIRTSFAPAFVRASSTEAEIPGIASPSIPRKFHPSPKSPSFAQSVKTVPREETAM